MNMWGEKASCLVSKQESLWEKIKARLCCAIVTKCSKGFQAPRRQFGLKKR
jgi:hypothetical protein